MYIVILAPHLKDEAVYKPSDFIDLEYRGPFSTYIGAYQWAKKSAGTDSWEVVRVDRT